MDLEETCLANIKGERYKDKEALIKEALHEVFKRVNEEAVALYAPGVKRKSDFFRDIAGSRYLSIAEDVAKQSGINYDLLVNLYDKAIIEADGLLINSIKSCNSFSAGQLLMMREIEKRTGKPAAFVETDLVDPRYFSASNVKNRLESYFQMIDQKRQAA